jgi:microsomal dipeptidase-like Zn-dependent dipeptidase
MAIPPSSNLRFPHMTLNKHNVIFICFWLLLCHTSNGQRSNGLFDGTIYNSRGNFFLVIGGGVLKAESLEYRNWYEGTSRLILLIDSNLSFVSPMKDTILVRELKSPNVYLITKNTKQLVNNRLLKLFFADAFVNVIPDNSLVDYRDGTQLPSMQDLPASKFDSLRSKCAIVLRNYYNKNVSMYVQHLKNYHPQHQKIILDNFRTAINTPDLLRIPPSSMRQPIDPRMGSSYPRSDSDGTPVRNPRPPAFKLTPNPSMRGFADIHNHQFANLAFGGTHIAGAANGNAIQALDPCCASLTSNIVGDLGGAVVCAAACSLIGPLWLPCYLLCEFTLGQTIQKAIEVAIDGSTRVHGTTGSEDHVGNLMLNSYLLFSGKPQNVALIQNPHGSGANLYDNWPKWYTVNHQTVYKAWLKRAFNGGLRLLVMDAVENEYLCDNIKQLNIYAGSSPYSCDEMESAMRQINAAKQMEIDIARDDGGWYKIVYNSTQAENAIKEGRLAVVLGIEVSNLLGCKSGCELEDIALRFDSLYDKGIRVVFPIHENDNVFGGTSYFAHWPVQGDSNNESLIRPSSIIVTEPNTKYDLGRMNTKGITPKGEYFITHLMNKGAIIEVDHQSKKTRDAVLNMAISGSYPGIVSSHTGFFEINGGSQRHEGQIELNDLLIIDRIGGIVAPILNQGTSTSNIRTYPGNSNIQHTCGWTTESWSQAYRYATTFMKIHKNNIAIGTDFNGQIPPLGPRFGSHACPGGGNTFKPQLTYPFVSLFDNKSILENEQGNKKFNINTDGVAHMGLLPDMFGDLQVLGMSNSELEPLFNSAKAYVQMWKKSEATRLITYFKSISKSPIIVKELSRGQKYLLKDGGKTPITEEVYNRCYSSKNILTIPDGSIGSLPSIFNYRHPCR